MQHQMIRLFVSSTFRDFETERNELMQEVYPKLEVLCKKNGFSFQVIDLRWGVSKEDVAENRSAWICFDEIRRCQELSPQLNFLIMAGNRYGWRPLPTKIDADEWELLIGDLSCDSYLTDLLGAYYQQDLNDLNNKYILLPRGGLNLASNDEYLRTLLYTQAKKNLSAEAASKYNTSATEQEILRGYFNADQSRINTFVMLKVKNAEKENTDEANQEPEMLQVRAAELRDRLIQSMNSGQNTGQLCVYQKGSRAYLKQAENFLADIIEAQIKSSKTKTEYEQEQETLNHLYQSISAGYIPLPWHEKAIADCENHAGSCILLTGNSGCGKSYFLKHLAMVRKQNGEMVAAVFNDVQPQGRSLFSALEYLVEHLCAQGLLENEKSTSSLRRSPVEWFEAQLQKIQFDRSITIIIDSIDNISDYKQADKGLFQIKLPNFVTMIVSAKSQDDLLQSDLYPKAPEVIIQVNALSQDEGIDLLCALLRKRKRLLQREQIIAAKDCLFEPINPLSVELLAQICQKLHSWDQFKYPDIRAFDELVKTLLFREGRDDYVIFRTHAIGYIALSSVGLTEAELIELLSKDQAVVEEIRRQTEWNFEIIGPDQHTDSDAESEYRGKIPVVLWAMLYADIRDLLTDIVDHGIFLLQIRHSRLKQAILQSIPSAEREKLLQIMCSYFGEQRKQWIFQDGERITANRRKVCELFPLYEQLGRIESIRKELDSLLCVDAFVRCGMRQNIRAYLVQYASSLPMLQILELLRKKDLLFRMWPDSFLPAALPELRLHQNDSADLRKKKELLSQVNQSYLLVQRGIGFLSKGTFFPQLNDTCTFALNDNGFVAVYSVGIIRMIDMNQQIFTQIACATVQEDCFLYWNENFLFLRCARKRLCYNFQHDQLVEYWSENCPNWNNLIIEKKIPEAGGWIEAETFGTFVQHNHIQYFADGKKMQTLLFYDSKHEPYVRTHGSMAAVVIDGEQLEIVDLYRKKVIQRHHFSIITHVEWSPSGKEVLVVLHGNTLIRIKIDRDVFIDDMPRPTQSYQQYLLRSIADYIEDAGETVVSFASMQKNAIIRMSPSAQQIPLYAALSVRYGWFACYYNKGNIGQLQLYNLTDHRPLWKNPQETDAIKPADAVGMPLYPACDRNGLIFVAGRKTRLLDLEQKKWITAPDSALKQKKLEPKLFQQIIDEYTCFMVNELHLRTLPDPVNSRAKGFWQRLGTKSFDSQLNLKDYQACLPYFQLRSSEVLKGQKNLWLIDRYNGIVLAYDFRGRCIYKDMIEDRILAADEWNGKLYLLPERTEQRIELFLC